MVRRRRAAVIWADRRFKLGHGRVFALYVAAYTVGRFWIEYLRVDDAHHVLGLRLNDWTSIVVFLGGGGLPGDLREEGPRPGGVRRARRGRRTARPRTARGGRAGGARPGASPAGGPRPPEAVEAEPKPKDHQRILTS